MCTKRVLIHKSGAEESSVRPLGTHSLFPTHPGTCVLTVGSVLPWPESWEPHAPQGEASLRGAMWSHWTQPAGWGWSCLHRLLWDALRRGVTAAPGHRDTAGARSQSRGQAEKPGLSSPCWGTGLCEADGNLPPYREHGCGRRLSSCPSVQSSV